MPPKLKSLKENPGKDEDKYDEDRYNKNSEKHTHNFLEIFMDIIENNDKLDKSNYSISDGDANKI